MRSAEQGNFKLSSGWNDAVQLFLQDYKVRNFSKESIRRYRKGLEILSQHLITLQLQLRDLSPAVLKNRCCPAYLTKVSLYAPLIVICTSTRPLLNFYMKKGGLTSPLVQTSSRLDYNRLLPTRLPTSINTNCLHCLIVQHLPDYTTT